MRSIWIFLCVISSFLLTSCVFVDSPEPESNKLGCYETVVTCGCHGYVIAGQRESTPYCESGVHEAVLCYNMGYCPSGGLPWRTVCSC